MNDSWFPFPHSILAEKHDQVCVLTNDLDMRLTSPVLICVEAENGCSDRGGLTRY